jgi:hypothetical protein
VVERSKVSFGVEVTRVKLCVWDGSSFLVIVLKASELKLNSGGFSRFLTLVIYLESLVPQKYVMHANLRFRID